MATTVAERKLLVAGEWVETGEWIEIARPTPARSWPGSRRRARGTCEPRSTLRRRRSRGRCRRTSAPRSSAKVAGALGRRQDEVAQTICAEAGKPLKTARVEASRAVSTYTMAAVEARKLTGEMVPMDASQAGEGKLAFTLRRPIGIVGAITPVQLPAQPRRTQARAGARRGLPRGAEAGDRDTALRAPARRADDGSRPAARAGSRSSSATRPRSATCSSRTSA